MWGGGIHVAGVYEDWQDITESFIGHSQLDLAPHLQTNHTEFGVIYPSPHALRTCDTRNLKGRN